MSFLIDFALVVLVFLAAWHGYRRGAILQLASYGGVLAGLGAAVGIVMLLAAPITRLGPERRAVVAMATLIFSVAVTEMFGFRAGLWIKRRIGASGVNRADRVLGSLVGGVALLVIIWVVAGIFVASPLGGRLSGVSEEIRRSRILAATSEYFPGAEDALGPLRNFLNTSGLPFPLPPFRPPDAPPVAIDPSTPSLPAVKLSAASVYMVKGRACDREVEGSGWVPRRGYLVTAAHVVAGMRDPTVIDGNRSLRATVTHFDAGLDLAVLAVPSLDAAPIAVGNDPAPGTRAATVGFPRGGPKVISPAAVRTTSTTRGTSIYGTGSVVRHTVMFSGEVVPGSSGGPLLDGGGRVIGTIFASSATATDEDYAISPSGLLPAIAAGTSSTRPVSTGRCA